MNLSFLPTLSVGASFLVIAVDGMLNTVAAIRLESGQTGRKLGLPGWAALVLTGFPYVLSTIAYRVVSWVMICSQLVELSFVPILVVFLANVCTLVCFADLRRIEPAVCALFSMVMPIAFLPSSRQQHSPDQEEEGEGQVVSRTNRVVWILSLFGTCVIAAINWTLYGLVSFKFLRLNPSLRMHDDVLHHTGVLSVVGAASVALGALNGLSQAKLRSSLREEAPAGRRRFDFRQLAVVAAIAGTLAASAGASLAISNALKGSTYNQFWQLPFGQFI